MPYVERRVPVIADERVERDFGTGALKVTPGHDPLDYEIGRDHGLPEITAIGPDGRMNDEAGDLAGLTQEEADERILAWLKEHDQLEKRESYRHTVGVLRPLQDAHRAADLAAVVLLDGRAEEAGARGDAHRPRDVPSRVAAPLRGRVARGRARLEHLAPDLVGPSAAAVGMPGRPRHGRGDGAGRVRRVRLVGAHALDRRARHVVLVRALAVRDARLAGRHRGPAHVLPRRSQHDRARHHPPLGEPDDLLRARADGRRPVPATSSSTRSCTRPRADGCRRASAPA